MRPPDTPGGEVCSKDGVPSAHEDTTSSSIMPAFTLEDIYRSEAGRLSNYFNRRLAGDDEPSDYVHEVFARLARRMLGNTIHQPHYYLRRIAKNLLFERTRRLKTRVVFDHIPLTPEFEPAVLPDQTYGIETQDVLRAYRRALHDLAPKTQEIFLLHRVDELSYREIGERLGISIPTVQYHMARALTHLDAVLGHE